MIGLRSRERTELRVATPARVNLLPPEVLEVRRFRRVQYGLGGMVLAAVGIVVLLFVLALGGVSSAQKQVDATRTEQSQLQGQLTKLNGVRLAYSQVAAGQAQLQSALGGEVQMSHFLNDLSLTIPTNVWLTGLTYNLTGPSPQAGAAATGPTVTPGIGTLTATGSAFAHDDVAAWLVSLGRQKGYADPYFSDSTMSLSGARRIVTFTSTATITADALSHRYDRLPGA